MPRDEARVNPPDSSDVQWRLVATVEPDGSNVVTMRPATQWAETEARLAEISDIVNAGLRGVDPVTGEDLVMAVVGEDEAQSRARDMRNVVWAMRTPSRTGNARMTDLSRPYMREWRDRWDAAQGARMDWDLFASLTAQRVPRVISGYRRPDMITGTSYVDDVPFVWWFLGWHGDRIPMFAVQSANRLNRFLDEALARRAIRQRIAHCVHTYTCDRCFVAFPSTQVFPPPAGHAAMVRVPGWGRVARCAGCAEGLTQCAGVGRDGSRCEWVGTMGEELFRIVHRSGEPAQGFCHDHRGTIAVQCGHCVTWFRSVDALRAHNCMVGDPRVRSWVRCAQCSHWTCIYQTSTMSNGSIAHLCDWERGGNVRCASRTRVCSYCNLRTLTPAILRGQLSDRVCEECCQRMEVEFCEHCQRNYPASDNHDCAADGGCRCDRCRYSQGPIRSYSYRPRPSFKGTNDNGLYLGMELEVFAPRNSSSAELVRLATLAQEGLGKVAYLKTDGSIGHGFEMVTHPMTYAWAMESFPWGVLPELASNGCYANDGAGIHVHASRKGFTGPAHEYRWMIFMHRNNAQVSMIARRVSDQWASWSDEQRKIAKEIATKKRNDHTRYRAINQTNDQTIEIRVFKSSLNPTEAKAALALVHASITYARQIRSRDVLKDEAWSWGAFATWVSKRKEYAPLWSEMQARGCTGNDPVPAPLADSEEDSDGCGYGYACLGGNGDEDCRGRCLCPQCADHCGCPYGCFGQDDACRGRCGCDRCQSCANPCSYECNGDNDCDGECVCDDCDGMCDPPEDGTPEPDSDLDQTDYIDL